MISYEDIIERVVSWAEYKEDIRAIVIIGSRARSNVPADKWSDLDLVIFALDPSIYIKDTKWVKGIGEPKIVFLEKTAVGNELEVRVLFDGGLDVEFAMIPAVFLKGDISLFADVASRGMRVLLDRDGVFSNIEFNSIKIKHNPPDEFKFQNTIKDFWYHAVWTAKKLLRGELWVAKSCCDGHMKDILLRMIEWYSLSKHGWDYDVWHRGRFLEQWADKKVLDELKNVYAYYVRDDVKKALFNTMNLFREISRETAKNLGYTYPLSEDEYATKLVEELFN